MSLTNGNGEPKADAERQCSYGTHSSSFNAKDAKWSWLGRAHVQSLVLPIAVCTCAVPTLLLLFSLVALHVPLLSLCLAALVVLLLFVGLLAVVANWRCSVPWLFMPYILTLWVLCIICLALFLAFVPMAIFVPHFWAEWTISAFGLNARGAHVIGISRSVTAAFALLWLALLVLLTFFNFTVLRARLFVIAKMGGKNAVECHQMDERKRDTTVD